VKVDSRQEVYDLARKGQADLVISHYGHSQADAFFTEGLGLLPRIVFANQSALIGPLADPAGVRGLTDAVAAFRRIADTRSPFVVDSSETERYLAEFLWEAAGRPDREDWYFDDGLQGPEAVRDAARRGGYTLWGLVPFLQFRERSGIEMEPSVVADSLFQRFMVCVVVNPERIKGVNVEGAKALQRYLMAPATQARIRAFRSLGSSSDVVAWGSQQQRSVLAGSLALALLPSYEDASPPLTREIPGSYCTMGTCRTMTGTPTRTPARCKFFWNCSEECRRQKRFKLFSV